MQINHPVYFSRQQAALQSEGFHVVGVMSSHMDALSAPSVGTRIYKLPNPMYSISIIKNGGNTQS